MHQENRSERCGQGKDGGIITRPWRNAKDYLIGEETGFGMQFSLSSSWASLILHERCASKALWRHASFLTWERWTPDSFPGKRRTWKHRQGPQEPLQCQWTRVSDTFPSCDVPAPAKELQKRKPSLSGVALALNWWGKSMASCPCQGFQGHWGLPQFLAAVTWYFFLEVWGKLCAYPCL